MAHAARTPVDLDALDERAMLVMDDLEAGLSPAARAEKRGERARDEELAQRLDAAEAELQEQAALQGDAEAAETWHGSPASASGGTEDAAATAPPPASLPSSAPDAVADVEALLELDDDEPCVTTDVLATDEFPEGHEMHVAAKRFDAIKCAESCGCKAKLDVRLTTEILHSFLHASESDRRAFAHAFVLLGVRVPGLPIPQDASRHKSRRTSSETPQREAKRSQAHYTMFGVPVCRNTFLGVYNIGPKLFANRISAVKDHEFHPAVQTKRSQNAKGVCHTRTLAAEEFLREYAETKGAPDPAGGGADSHQPRYVLPVGTLRGDVYKEYKYTLQQQGTDDTALAYSSFLNVWHQKTPHIRIGTPRTDYCDNCKGFMLKNDDAGLQKHRRLAHAEDRFQRAFVEDSREHPGDYHVVMFDFAEKIRLPIYTVQAKQAFFENGLNVDLFGVADATDVRQTNYVLTEGYWPVEKGPDVVISMLHDALHARGLDDVPLLFLAADNCTPQNKNNYVMRYLAWRVLTFNHQEIRVHFRIAGHTKMLCDAGFGMAKKRLKNRDVYNAKEAFELIHNSSKTNDQTRCATDVRWRDWKNFGLSFGMRDIPDISQKQYFVFKKSTPGVVLTRQYFGEPLKPFTMTKKDRPITTDLPGPEYDVRIKGFRAIRKDNFDTIMKRTFAGSEMSELRARFLLPAKPENNHTIPTFEEPEPKPESKKKKTKRKRNEN